MAKSHKPASSPVISLFESKGARNIAVAALAVLVLLDLVVKHYRHFAIDGTFGFAAWFGAVACLALIFLALAVGSLLHQPEGTYDD